MQGHSAGPVPTDGPDTASNQPQVHSTGVFAEMDSDDDLELLEVLSMTQALEVCIKCLSYALLSLDLDRHVVQL